MNRLVGFIVFAASLVIALGCASSGSPVAPLNSDIGLKNSQANAAVTQTQIWGYYDVFIDIPSKTATAVPNREAMFTANVTNFLNSKPANLGFHINGTPIGADFIDVDIDITITHPFPGLHQYDGYDVRGVFMGDGSATLAYNPDLHPPVLGTDQCMLPDPTDNFGGPDGYTRWFNKLEFSGGGMPLFQYTQGRAASPGFDGSATLCPYKYFTDNLGKDDNLWTWLNDPINIDSHGIFSAGSSNTRNYYLRFPNGKGIKYGYAVIATWVPDVKPANAPEAIALSVVDNSTLFYSGPSSNGGDIVLNVGVWDWDSHLSAGIMEDYKIFIESSVLTTPYAATSSDMTPVGGGENYSTYHFDIPADNIQSQNGNQYWVIVEQQGHDYTNDFGVANLADTDPLAALFRYDLRVGTSIPAIIQLIQPNGGESLTPGAQEEIKWTSSGLTGTILIEYSSDDFVSDIHTIDPGAPDTGSFMWTVPCDPSTTLKVRVTSNDLSVTDKSDADFTIVGSGWGQKWGDTGYEEAQDVAFDKDGNIYIQGTSTHVASARNWGFVTKFDPCGNVLWSKSWGGLGLTQGYGVAVDNDGNVYTTGNFYGTCDFDPDHPGGPNFKTSVGGSSWDAWLNVFDTDGNFKWVRTWGGVYSDSGQGVAVDENGGVYVTGFYTRLVDFNPEGGDPHQSNDDSFDPFVCKYNSSGDFQWAKTWGSINDDRAWDIAYGGGNCYATGDFAGTDVNFNPDGSFPLNSNGSDDIFLTAWSASGVFQWAKNWGGTIQDAGSGVASDSAGNVYSTGYYRGYNVNFNPDGSDIHNSNGGGMDAFLSKFSSAGDFQWARTWGGSSMESCEDAAVGPNGEVYAVGFFYMTCNFDPSGTDNRTVQGANFYEDAYVSKFDSAGTYQWVHAFGSVSNDRGFGIDCNPEGDVYATGFFNGTANFAPSDGGCSEAPSNETPNGAGADAFLVKYLGDGCW